LATSSISFFFGGGNNFFHFLKENIWNIWKFNVNSTTFANVLKKVAYFSKIKNWQLAI
jgi:hypothetical protein